MTAVVAYTAEFVEREYNNRAACPDHPVWFERWARESSAAYAAANVRRDLRYGAGPKETLDLFVPPQPARATLAFIHGGYWRALDKSDFGFVAQPFVAQRIAVANINYDLCPDVTVAQIVDEIRRAVVWLAREGPRHGAPAPTVLSGHSVGGHAVAMMYVTDWRRHGFDAAPFVAGVSLSGVHDLAPLPLFSFNTDIRLTDAEARRMSPLSQTPSVAVPLLAAVGADETSEFVRQTRLLWDAWPAQRPSGMAGPLVIPGKHHFSVVSDYADASSAVTRATLDLFPL
jgi:arylformamidase